MIPLIDLSIDKKMQNLILSDIAEVLKSKNYILGQKLKKFEEDFANFIGSKFAVGVGNGTDAIRLSLRALGIGYGDKVLTVALTSPFTILAILQEGAIPVFCDIDETTWTIDIGDIERKIDKKTRAIIPVHLFGNPCDMDRLTNLARKYKLNIIEDACQAHAAIYKNKRVGSFGDAAAFSFYPTKNLGALGDGGIVATNSEKIANLVKILRHGGQTKRFWHQYAGINSRLDEIQAAILLLQFKRLAMHNQKRETLVKTYRQKLSDLPISFQESFPHAKSANHLFVIRTKKRKGLKKYLLNNNILCDIYYPYPIHKQPAFKKYAKGKLPVTEKLANEILALPLFPQLKFEDQNKVIKTTRRFFAK